MWREFTGARWILHTKGQKSGKCFHLKRSFWIEETGFLDRTNPSFVYVTIPSFVYVTILYIAYPKSFALCRVFCCCPVLFNFICILQACFTGTLAIMRLTVLMGQSWGRPILLWRRNEQDGVSNHQSHDCLLNRLFRRRSKQASKLRVIGLFAGNSLGTGEFPAQMASNAENVSIWWRHHVYHTILFLFGRTPSSQRPATWSFDIFFDPRLNTRLSKQSRRRWFETPLRSLWRQCYVLFRRQLTIF